jgi:hypothetical protein
VEIWHTTSLTCGKHVREDITHKSALSFLDSIRSFHMHNFKLGMKRYKKKVHAMEEIT